jgi:hypothetical protein
MTRIILLAGILMSTQVLAPAHAKGKKHKLKSPAPSPEASAQAPASPQAESPAPSASPDFKPPAPPPEMAQLADWLGRWNVTAIFEKGGMIPGGGTSKGVLNVRKGLLETAYIAEFSMRGVGGRFSALRIRSYEPEGKKWKSWWFDGWSSGHVEAGAGSQTTPGTWVFEAQSDMQGQAVKTRTTEIWEGKKKVVETYEMDRGQGFQKQATITYTRR